MSPKARAFFWTYVSLALIAPAGILLYLQYESILRQNRTIRELTTANLTLSGQQIAAKIEHDYYEGAGDLLRKYSGMSDFAVRKPRIIPSPGRDRGCAIDPAYDALFVVEPEGPATAICGSAAMRKRWADSYIALLDSHEPGKVLAIGIVEPTPAQFFYVEDALERYWVVSVDLRTLTDDLGPVAYVLQVPGRPRLVPAGAAAEKSEVLVCFPTLFPFRRIAVSPGSGQEQGDGGIRIFAALTSVVICVLMFALALLTRANWRYWRLSRVREEFVQGVSHDIRNPVNNISMYSEMLLNIDTPPEQTRRSHEILFQEAQRLSSLVTRVLQVSKTKRGPGSARFALCDPREIVLNAVEAVDTRAGSQGFRIEVIQPEAVPAVLCDRDSIMQCLMELLENAVKFSGNSRRIDVALAVRGGALRMAVRDYGIGIPPHEIPRIFDQFYRAENARDHQGSGLGLHLVKLVMDSHGGRVEVSSLPPQGSEFCLILPL